MKKIIFAVATLLSITAFTTVYASDNSVPMEYLSPASAEIYTVKAVKDPSKGITLRINLIISWDGDECLVLGRDGKYFDEPIRAHYSDRYKGYPWVVTIGRETWYFAN